VTRAADHPEICDIPAFLAAVTVHLPHWRFVAHHNIMINNLK
jgi:hypothetical protein